MNNNITACQPWLAELEPLKEQMVEETTALARINSGTFNAEGVNQVLQRLKDQLAPLGGHVETLNLPPFTRFNDQGEHINQPLGQALRISKRPQAPLQVMLGGHMDTVFGPDHPFQTVHRRDADTLAGPGVTDLKGGLVVMRHALETLEKSPWARFIGWQILLNPDEEIGSPCSAWLIEETARRVHLGLIYEPCLADGALVGQRKGSGNFTVLSHGRAAHAGRAHHLGRNAVRALCEFICALDDLNGQRPGVTINPGFIHGGGASNIVPDFSLCHVNIRIEQPDDEAWCHQHLDRLIRDANQKDGIRLSCHGGFGRKPKILTQANHQLLALTQACGASLGLDLPIKPSGGCCDGNNLAALGVANIDTLGVQGDHIHSDQEYLNVNSLVPRARLSALLLMQLARQAQDGTLDWLDGEKLR